MARFYLPPDEWTSGTLILTGDESRHAAKVLRLREGDSCVVFDGKGKSAKTHIAHISPQEVGLAVDELLPPSPPAVEITLCQSIPKGSNMDLIIQKSVELGVSRIVPLITEHTIVRVSPNEAAAKQAKWQRIALEACKQCGQNTLPVVKLPQPFSKWLEGYKAPEVSIIASLAPGARPIRGVLEESRTARRTSAAILVGPEGDFTAQETSAALDGGFLPVTLGSIVMRVETASFFCISAVKYSLE